MPLRPASRDAIRRTKSFAHTNACRSGLTRSSIGSHHAVGETWRTCGIWPHSAMSWTSARLIAARSIPGTSSVGFETLSPTARRLAGLRSRSSTTLRLHYDDPRPSMGRAPPWRQLALPEGAGYPPGGGRVPSQLADGLRGALVELPPEGPGGDAVSALLDLVLETLLATGPRRRPPPRVGQRGPNAPRQTPVWRW